MAACPKKSRFACFDGIPPANTPFFAAAKFSDSCLIWTSTSSQCICGNATQTPCLDSISAVLAINSQNLQGSYQGPKLLGAETGNIAGQGSVKILKPQCPDNYFVLGHICQTADAPIPDSYYCISQARRETCPRANRGCRG